MSIHHGSAGSVPRDTTQQQPVNGNESRINGATNGAMKHEVCIYCWELVPMIRISPVNNFAIFIFFHVR